MELESGLAMKPMDKSLGNFLLLRSLRNADRECFIDCDSIGFWKHWKWWRRYCSGSNQLFFEIWLGRKKVGFISRSRIETLQYEIGNLMLKKKFRGRGIMSWAVGILSAYDEDVYYARTLEENISSRNVFIRAGFARKGISWAPNGAFIITWMKGKLGED